MKKSALLDNFPNIVEDKYDESTQWFVILV